MTKHKSSDERTEQILAAARRCFVEKGYFATKMDEIARAAGLSKGGVYFHFSSKHDIFRALVQREYDTTIGFLDSIAVEEGGFIEKLVGLSAHFGDRFGKTDNPRFTIVVAEMSFRDAEINALLQQMNDTYVEKISQILEAGVARGQLRPLDARSTAFLLRAMVDGIQLSYALDNPMRIEHVVAPGVEMIMRGLIDPSYAESQQVDTEQTATLLEEALTPSTPS